MRARVRAQLQEHGIKIFSAATDDDDEPSEVRDGRGRERAVCVCVCVCLFVCVFTCLRVCKFACTCFPAHPESNARHCQRGVTLT
jgi:hypothetical protein